uniref:Uncharacterized protein n=1 Tax=Glossina austeni TaxID=7395 RepID=A0A1A9UJ88_GLOAU
MLTMRIIRMAYHPILRPIHPIKPLTINPYKQSLRTMPYVNQRHASDSKKHSTKPPEIKLPSREQLEKYFFRATVVVWDTSVYLYSVTARLFDQYVLRQPVLQQYWAVFKKKMDQARQEMRSK